MSASMSTPLKTVSHSSRRYAVWKASGSTLEYVEFMSREWSDYDREHGISVSDRAFSLVTYNQHQEAFSTWLEARHHHNGGING